MVSSIASGTLLRQRYLIKQILGQGGFGRTYLAVDQERFDELCVIKEFTVPYQDDSLVEKAKALFQREASTLYQIQHPQIPRFWAAFESEQRLFLVQDFVQGQTYRDLLQARRQNGEAFSQAEILHLLNHLLPVLAYLHDRDIIHRDISPENIILRAAEVRERVIPAVVTPTTNQSLPILIDFGAVKEAASHWPIISTITRVGKVGYAPPEQLQTGNVSPHSDLYALGATCLVLLTGREPQNLLDSQTLAWQWQPYSQISDELALIFQKMLSLHPSDRYQSAREAWADLQPLIEESVKSTLLNPMSQPLQLIEREIAPAARDTSLKQVTTTIRTRLSMSSNTEDEASGRSRSGLSRSSSVSRKTSTMSRFAVPTAIATSLLVSTGIGLHLFRITDPLPSTQQIRTAAPFRNSGTVSNGEPQRIVIPAGEISAVLQGNLLEQTSQPYTVEAAQGQIMTVTVEGTGVLMNLLQSNGQAIDSSSHQTRNWTGQLPKNDRYTIQVTGVGSYSLDVAITPISQFIDSNIQHVRFPRNKTQTVVTGKLQPNQSRKYLLKASGRQVMAVRVLKGKSLLTVLAPNGQRIGGSSTESQNWQGRLPMDGEYTIEIISDKPEEFALGFEIY
ncbi:protein kinase domain [Leptolyngbya boryana NIES-2135]|jgi:serine/threonine protein kinase|uniref:non-specific serine/threonine protein kinase n=1 Tax=Leptolyngbya boryana NIES-2135 TaxID=1973484 RepID=A0A1Z4JKH7_LEPBY|nr:MULTISPECIES: serine/threonine-protein kinase [Leptolyngbya]BAY57244.1 protein kinase domain [Leptolyngbya boryana NIES-2135]MBD2367006.1 serine/threonine protein kinase [Leptolyngbya sp. FACHB-161]MBD2373640.1 serine/threonine protein kinase [Leptolyngbya sp. FACHB-238]MBD2398049.1 serine/threonine protein kinase [Leptolyngbya sp. FACHB-239]MBD2404551.1 serine/threonine protein kinase [Leptolyngbya sp. FACHB-402]